MGASLQGHGVGTHQGLPETGAGSRNVAITALACELSPGTGCQQAMALVCGRPGPLGIDVLGKADQQSGM